MWPQKRPIYNTNSILLRILLRPNAANPSERSHGTYRTREDGKRMRVRPRRTFSAAEEAGSWPISGVRIPPSP